jgi:hypothetical protein
MKFEVYCDESRPDLFTSQKRNARYLMIGSLWLPAGLRNEVKDKIKGLRQRHNTWGEIKWTKVSPSRLPFYLDLIDLFEAYGMDMRFRCIAVDSNQVDMNWHENDSELGFYKFYYQLLHHWILDFNEYRIFCDTKTNRDLTRLKVLHRCLNRANLSSRVSSIQALPSRQVVLIQLSDLLLGAASSRLNQTLQSGSPKEAVVQRLESHLGVTQLHATHRDEEKFNIFQIRLQGGW